jgi:hypothetical protein
MCGTTLDWIIDLVEVALKQEDYETIDNILAYTDIKYILEGPNMSDAGDIVVGLLTATLCCKDELPSRYSFYEQVKRYLKDDSLLAGLE